MTARATKSAELARGERFEFGENWRRFLATVDDVRIREAARSLREMLDVERLHGLSVLDVGCGSGLFSLAAVQLGAARVYSFDYDAECVLCAAELKRRFAPSSIWQLEPGDALDGDYVASLGQFDFVYAWGVLHHSGDMRAAMATIALAVAPQGRLFLSIYNDQGRRSRRWLTVKRTYNRLPPWLHTPFVVAVMGPRELRAIVSCALRPQKMRAYIRSWTEYRHSRGMSRWHDLVDWCGGYPFEVAKPEEVFDFYRGLGFSLERLRTCGGSLGCNEFVFKRGTSGGTRGA